MGPREKVGEQEQTQEHEQLYVQIEDRMRAPIAAQMPHELPCEDSSSTLAICTKNSISAFSSQPEPAAFSLQLTATASLPECRICQEEDDPSQLEAPCNCSGTLKYAHRECLQRWCNEKGDTTCEICLQPYKQGYIFLSQFQAGSVVVDLSDTWEMELRDPRILALAAAQRQLLESDYSEYSPIHSRSAVCCRSMVLILMALLLLRHATAMAAATEDEDALLFLTVRLSCGCMGFSPNLGSSVFAYDESLTYVRAMHMLQRGPPPEQAAAATATEVRVLLRGRDPRGIRVALVPAVDLS